MSLRKAAGFPTAYRFFHDNGGKPVLGFSYRKYLLFEQGLVLPAPQALGRISLALKQIPKSPAAGGFMAAWLRTMAGDDTFAFIFEPFLSIKTDTPGLSPIHKAMGRFLRRQPITVPQAARILSTGDHYRAFVIFENDAGPWKPEALAGAVGLSKPAAVRILADFMKVGVVKKQRNGTYVPAHPGSILEFPRAEIMPAGLNDRMRGYQAEMAASGTLVWRRLNMVRADAVELAAFYPVMSLNMSAAAAYEVSEKTGHSAMFAIEGRITKLFDF